MKKRTLCIGLLCLCLLLACIPWTGLVLAGSVVTGTVHVDDSLRVRSGPGTGYPQIGSLYNGDVVTILETSADGKWYKITKDSLSGYASADYITINARYDTDGDFEAYLTAQGFPESYKPALRQLHAAHPQWIFKAKSLTMTFDTALTNEARIGRNNIQNPEAWRSMEYGAYDWSSGSYVSFDSGGWYSAETSVTAYYMDPRNWLDDTYVFQFEELNYSADQTADGIRAILPDALDKHADDLLSAARASGVSAYFLAAKIVQEGTLYNGLATGTVKGYEGYYNFFDIGAYAANGNSAVTNGAIYAKNRGWDTPYKCFVDSANMLGQSYIKLGQNTSYFQKFNVVNTTSGLYGHQYMTAVYGAASEGSIRRRNATAEQLNAALVFVIPVYQSMPQTVAAKPATTGNNNNFLDSLTVSGCTLTPTFDRYRTSYAVQVESAVSAVSVSGSPNNAGATVSGGGTIQLQRGENTVQLTVTATSGAKRVYTVTITREGGSDGPTPTITGAGYTIHASGILSGVEPETAVSEFIEKLAVRDGTAWVYAADGSNKTTGPVCTGDILRLYSGNTLCASYPVVIYGDVNGDGRVTSADLRTTQKHILGVASVTGYYATAADANKDGRITSADLRMTQKFILRVLNTLQ